VADIMAAVDEDTRMTRCGGEEATPCVPGRRCLTHGLWNALGDQIAAFLESVTLQEVIDGIPPSKRAARTPGPAMVRAMGLSGE
jgi:DNA-binding IscR family transcriptional regulator